MILQQAIEMCYAANTMILSQPSSNGTDPLSDVLAALGARSIRRTRLEAAGHWGLAFPAQARLKFVALLRGAAWLVLPGQPAIAMASGDVCLLGKTAYAVASSPDVAPVNGRALYEGPDNDVVRLGGDETVMLGGGIAFADDLASFLLDALPAFILLPAATDVAAMMTALLAMLEAEVTRPRAGSTLVAGRLAEILLVEAIRSQAADAIARPGWIAALADPQIGAALRLMHRDVAHPWTVEALARGTGMSRSAFAARFLAQVGRPPQAYLRHWRMVLAQARLRSGNRSIAAVAEQVGYTSHSAFASAYHRNFGYPPGRNRRGTLQ
jgi:AraC-like DNA-binding protein